MLRKNLKSFQIGSGISEYRIRNNFMVDIPENPECFQCPFGQNTTGILYQIGSEAPQIPEYTFWQNTNGILHEIRREAPANF